jgi:predicted anti-sigma-YlaC factor YlaD
MEDAAVRPPAPHGASPDGPVGRPGEPFDNFFPKDIDWKKAALETVQRYPLSCLAGAVAVGFLVGRYRGRVIVGALAGVATNMVLRQLGESFTASDL